MRAKRSSPRFAELQLASLICMSACFAAPPPPEDPPLRSQPGMPAARLRLDLRSPEHIQGTDAYPSAPSGDELGTESDKASALHIPFAKAKSPAEAFAKRLQREGLPVARLWENESTLFCVGFNQKKQPGLWLIQKTP
jgi:hypothetical protein